MATILDLGLIEFLLPLFVFLFVFVIIYALLSKTELLGKNSAALNFIAAVCVAAVSIFAGNLVKLVSSVTPWIIFMIIVMVFMFGMFKFFDMKDKEIFELFGGPTVAMILVLIIVLIGLVGVFETQLSPYATGTSGATSTGTIATANGTNVQNSVITTLTHPRVLGALFLLIICAATIKYLVDKVEDKK